MTMNGKFIFMYSNKVNIFYYFLGREIDIITEMLKGILLKGIL